MKSKNVVDFWTKTVGIFPFKCGWTSLRNSLGTGGQILLEDIPEGFRIIFCSRHPRTRFNSFWNSTIPQKNHPTLEIFAEAVLTGDLKNNPHAYPQSNYYDGEIDIHIKLENIKTDYPSIKQYFIGAQNLLHENKSPTQEDAWGQLSTSYQDRLREYYDGDYIRFKYTD